MKPYDGDGCPPGRRDATDVRCPPTESQSHLPGRSIPCAREPLAQMGRGECKSLAAAHSPFRTRAASIWACPEARLGCDSCCFVSDVDLVSSQMSSMTARLVVLLVAIGRAKGAACAVTVVFS